MLSLEDAVELTLSSVTELEPEKVKLREALRRFSAQTLHAKVSLPGFDNSAMDGFAVVSTDLSKASESNPVTLKCSGIIPAGRCSDETVRPGHCMRIFTGSPVPIGADAVVMQEYCRINQEDGTVSCMDSVRPWENIRMQGEDVRSGDQVIIKGQRINTRAIGLLAATGHYAIEVGREPKVALVATGSELVEAPQELAPGQIYDSNRTMLAALLKSVNGSPKIYPIIRDELNATCKALEAAFKENDIVITSGGVSVGDHDHVKPAIEQLGGSINAWKVAIKPGKPFVLGQVNGRTLLGLPGNPASALVTYQLLVRPTLLKMQGATDCQPAKRVGVLAEEFTNKGDRRHFVRVSIDAQGIISSAGGQRSHMLGSLAKANALLDIPPHARLAKSDQAEVIMFED
tara:strand:- start:1619 stop:2824 length:1206 start_codon:yes stop_codon:yes gene_type:complete